MVCWLLSAYRQTLQDAVTRGMKSSWVYTVCTCAVLDPIAPELLRGLSPINQASVHCACNDLAF